MEWIKCSDRLPKPINMPGNIFSPVPDSVLVLFQNGHIMIGFYWQGQWSIPEPDYRNEIVTHWMPLPNPPQPCDEGLLAH